MSKNYGFERLREQLLDHVSSEIGWMIEEKDDVGDSEIEKLLFLSLVFKTHFGACEFRSASVAKTPEDRILYMESPHTTGLSLIVCPQFQIGDYRVDFLIHAMDMKKSGEKRVWRSLVVECDGHQFHERTKEQAAKDRSRDRWLTGKDFDVFRFTGSELWKDPWACAEQIIDWAIKGW